MALVSQFLRTSLPTRYTPFYRLVVRHHRQCLFSTFLPDRQPSPTITITATATTTPSKPPYLVVYSLGNPEPQYLGTRHNIGHHVADALCSAFSCSQWRQLLHCFASECATRSVSLLKSQTYMNVLGPAVAKNWKVLKKAHAGAHEPVLVLLHDELSLAVGKVQVRRRSASPRGHNGVKSVKAALGGGDYLSVAVGIGRPETRTQGDVSEYVLSRTPRWEVEVVDSVVVPRVVKILEEMLKGKYIYEKVGQK